VARITRIEVDGVSKLYGSTAALRGVSTQFEPGPITFIEGPNGAGKSTLLGIIGTMVQPTAGRVLYAPIGTTRLTIRSQIGWVAHESHCYRELSGRQNVELSARLYGVDPEEAWTRVSGRVGAEPFGDRPVGSLSRGQKQRIALARALVHDPSVLLLDEPLSGLDVAGMERMELILTQEAKRGTIVIVVSHQQGMARRLSGRRLSIIAGRLQRDEPLAEDN
jgi:heme exporter protein A